VCENISPVPVAGFFGAGVPSEVLAEHTKKGFEAAPASVWDPAARIKDQDLDGVQAEVIYTSMGMPLYGLDALLYVADGFRPGADRRPGLDEVKPEAQRVRQAAGVCVLHQRTHLSRWAPPLRG
jgi:hypothetical protein